MSRFTCTVIIAAGRGLGAMWEPSKSRFLTLTEGYLEKWISIKKSVTVMTNIQPYIEHVSIYLNHFRPGEPLSMPPMYHLSWSKEIVYYNSSHQHAPIWAKCIVLPWITLSIKLSERKSIRVSIWLYVWCLNWFIMMQLSSVYHCIIIGLVCNASLTRMFFTISHNVWIEINKK